MGRPSLVDAALEEHPECTSIRLEKALGETLAADQGMLDAPAWHWPSRS